MFESSFFINNRKALLKKVEADLVVIPAHRAMQRNGDFPYTFRQDSNFWYLTGINTADCILVLSKKETFLIIPKKDWVEDAFDGALDPKQLTQTSGIGQILFEREGWQKLTMLLKTHKKVGALPPMRLSYFNISPNPARQHLISKMKRKVPGLKIEDIRKQLAQMRMVKQKPELVALQKAIDITVDTIEEVFRPGWQQKYKMEYEIEADFTAGFRRRGADGNAWKPIVAAGKNTCTIHHIENNSKLKTGDLLLFDVGAEVSNYASDISRTIPIGTKFSARQQEVFDAVQDVHQFAMGLLKPGQDYIDYEKQVEQYMGKKLQELGLITKANRKNIRHYFPHRTSHMLGLDAHDAADYSLPLAENMVLTVEPGIYIPEEGIGVRIEDDVLITKTGHKVMSKNLPINNI